MIRSSSTVMAENVTSHDSYSEVELLWRSQREQEDSDQKKFYEELNRVPNLLALRSELQGYEKLEVLLRKQEEELKEGVMQYNLEIVRCHNLIIFYKLLLGRKQDALDYCESLKIDTSKSINFLTLKAMLQWEFKRIQEARATLKVLQDLYKLRECEYLLAVAESEKGYLMICIGPSRFHHALHLFQNAIDKCPCSDIYLWKFDLALAIRRNFNVHVYLKHSEFPPSKLAKQAITLLDDVVEKCPNEVYRSRAMLEQARLVGHLKAFCECDSNEKEHIEGLCEKYDENAYFKRALSTDPGKKDFYILRECGRQILYSERPRGHSRAIDCLEKSYVIRKSDLVCQLFGKAYLMMYRDHVEHFSPWIRQHLGMEQSGTGAADSPLSHNSGDQESATKPVSNDESGEITVESDEMERERLSTEFDSTPFMDKDGNFLAIQPEGFGNILPVQHSPSRDESGEITVESDERERVRLSTEFDSTPFMDKDGNFLAIQPEGFGNILPVQHSPSRVTSEEEQQLYDHFENATFLKTTQPDSIGNIQIPREQGAKPKVPVQHAHSDAKTLREKMLAEFDDDNLIGVDGEYKTTQPEGTVGNIKVSHVGSERGPMLKSLQSFPPDDTHLKRMASIRTPLLLSPDDPAFQQGSSNPRRTSLPSPGDMSPERNRSQRRPLLPTPVYTPDQRRGASSACRNLFSSPGDGSPGEMLSGRRDNSQHMNSFPQHGNSPSPGRVENSQRNSCLQDGKRVKLLKSKLEHISYKAADPRIKTAEHFYLEGLELNRFNISLIFDTGTLYERMGELEKALQFYQNIVDIQQWPNRITLVNAYERIGICLMKLVETCEDESERSTLKHRAEDMFMSSLVECRRAVAHLPEVSANRAILWDSYPQLLKILQDSELGAVKLKKEAKLHEEVGEHLKAVDVYKKVLELAENDNDRTQALLGTVKNYFRMGNVKNARFILDLFLTLLEEKIWMLTAADDVAKDLRDIAVEIYRQSGADALKNIPADALKARNIPDTCSAAFRMALLMKGKLLDEDIKGAASSQPSQAQPHSSEKKFDLSIFYDEEGPEQLSEVAKSVASSSRQFFGMRVSVNNDEGSLGQLDFESELQLAESTPLVMLVVDTEQELRPRMRFIANTALRDIDNNKVDLMLINVGRSTEPHPLLNPLRSCCEVDALLALNDENVSESSILSLFQFLLG